MKTLPYRIRDWNVLFESAASRKLKRLDWVAVPNKTDGEGYMELVDHPDGAAHLGAWYAIVEAASKQKIRGNLPGSSLDQIGVCRSLGKISLLPQSIFESVFPRLLKIGWLEQFQENQSDAESAATLGKSANALGESANEVAESQGHREGKGITGKGREGHGTGAPAPTVCARADRFAEFIAPWPRVANPDHAARCWLSVVDTPADEGLAFAARDRYLASDEISRGVVTDPAKWLMEQKSAKWGGRWPAPMRRAPSSATSTIDRAMDLVKSRIAKGERPI